MATIWTTTTSDKQEMILPETNIWSENPITFPFQRDIPLLDNCLSILSRTEFNCWNSVVILFFYKVNRQRARTWSRLFVKFHSKFKFKTAMQMYTGCDKERK